MREAGGGYRELRGTAVETAKMAIPLQPPRAPLGKVQAAVGDKGQVALRRPAGQCLQHVTLG